MHPRRKRPTHFDIPSFLGTDMSGGRFSYWAWGIVGSVLIAIYALKCIVVQSAEFVGRRPIRLVEYTGSAAIALGVIYLAVGVFMHCHCCWFEHKKYSGYAELGKLLAIIVFVGSFFYFVFDVIFLS